MFRNILHLGLIVFLGIAPQFASAFEVPVCWNGHEAKAQVVEGQYLLLFQATSFTEEDIFKIYLKATSGVLAEVGSPVFFEGSIAFLFEVKPGVSRSDAVTWVKNEMAFLTEFEGVELTCNFKNISRLDVEGAAPDVIERSFNRNSIPLIRGLERF